MLTVEGLLQSAKTRLASQTDLTFYEPALESRILFEHVSGKSHAWMIANNSHVLSAQLITDFENVLALRLAGKPIAYIIGKQDFWTLQLEVNESTLIPRQDTECLVETVLSFGIGETANVLDLGTGTGAIALALASEKPNWNIIGVDRIEDAVMLAKRNKARNAEHSLAQKAGQQASIGTSSETEKYRKPFENVRFLQSNWYEALHSKYKHYFDVIVSNPPYVEPDSEYLSRGDLRFEPNSALSAGENGFADLKHIITKAPNYLSANGLVALEHGANQHQALAKHLGDAGFVQIAAKTDYNGMHRVTTAQLP
ncbi:HemK/PrmC family methyltransferase [Ningiella sp. W23]|uniref:HemK/PrmC family methyltransferase n=1 Tax=Ningiella sp. W23 TaxID=3023715 RepID=UPI003758495A